MYNPDANIPKFENDYAHPYVGKYFKGNLDGFTFLCTSVKHVNNGLVILGDTEEYICQYYEMECTAC